MDIRNIQTGSVIRSDGYSDQPYIVKTDDNHWLMTVTTGSGHEGSSGQHVVSMRSADCGRTWQDEIPVSPPTLPESSYSVLYKTNYGRIYCFYNYNAENLRQVLCEPALDLSGLCSRVDTQGHFVFRYSDDNGKSWSENWYDIPQRMFAVDLLNPYHGEIKFFWNVGKPLSLDSGVYVPLYKIRRFGATFMEYSEGVLLHCSNIHTEKDPAKLVWETLPEGDTGIRAPQDLTIISEEHSFVPLSDGSVFCVFRTISGNSWCCYSRDDCHSFTAPEPMRYADGRPIKHPRAANFIWKCQNGKYLYWFHNHGGKGFNDRNPVWLSGAEEYMAEDGLRLRFGQPQPVLYDPDPNVRMSYPDLVEEDGEYYLTETQKTIARVHKLDRKQVESLWHTSDCGAWESITDTMPEPARLSLKEEHSFSLRFTLPEYRGAETLFSTIDTDRGLKLTRAEDGSLTLLLSDGQRTSLFCNDDPLLSDGKSHTVTAVFDGGVCAVYFVTDGRFCDGGDRRQFGFGRFDRSTCGAAGLQIPAVNKLKNLRFCKGIHLYD